MIGLFLGDTDFSETVLNKIKDNPRHYISLILYINIPPYDRDTDGEEKVC